MATSFTDRWGVPVRAGSAEAVALLDEAIEDLAALAGNPIARAEAAVAGAFAAGRPDRAIDLLIDIRPRANTVGGSHAQRDVIDLTLIAAAARAGDDGLARALVTERVARKPPAEPSATRLVTENGGSLAALRW